MKVVVHLLLCLLVLAYLPTTEAQVFFRVTLNFTDLMYTPALGDRNSPEFIELSSNLSRAIEALFRTTWGQQSVTILQFSPGSVLATFDLGSEGFDNPEVLRSYLEEAIQSGVLGSYGVSRKGFTFRSLGEPMVCPSYVGRESSRLPRTGNNWANLMVNNAFPCWGRVVGWEYYRLIPEGHAFVGVWRELRHGQFQLVDRTFLPPALIGEHSVLVNPPIPVERGDFLGIYYPQDAPNNVIASATLADDVLPASEMYKNYYIEFFDDDIFRGNIIDVNRYPNQQVNATFAIRALMNYEGYGVYTRADNEFTCDDGMCR